MLCGACAARHGDDARDGEAKAFPSFHFRPSHHAGQPHTVNLAREKAEMDAHDVPLLELL